MEYSSSLVILYSQPIETSRPTSARRSPRSWSFKMTTLLSSDNHLYRNGDFEPVLHSKTKHKIVINLDWTSKKSNPTLSTNIWYWLFWIFDRRKKLQWCFQCPVHCAIDVIPFCALAVKLNPWETHTWGGEGELPGAATSFDDGDRRETEILTTCLRNILTSRQPPTATESPDLQQLVMVSL